MMRSELNEILELMKYAILFLSAIYALVLTIRMAILNFEIAKNKIYKIWSIIKTIVKLIVMFYLHIVLAICDETLFLEVCIVYSVITYIFLRIKRLEMKMTI